MRIGPAAILFLVACGSSKPPEGPKQDDRIKALEAELQKAKDDLVKANAATDDLRKDEAELKAKADEANALQAKLAEAVGGNGEVTTADGAVKLELVDQILFPTGEADLTQSGKDVLAKVGAALKEINDKQIWVQGHTDDQPILKKPKPATPEPAKPKPGNAKDAKGKKAPAPKPDPKAKPETNDAVLPFVTNWELSAARAHRRPLPPGRREDRSDAARRRRVRRVPPGQQGQGKEPPDRDRPVPARQDRAEMTAALRPSRR